MCEEPFGSPMWLEQMVTQQNLDAMSRDRGRPKKDPANNGS